MNPSRTRGATANDLVTVVALDQRHADRSPFLERRLAEGRLLIAEVAGEIVGYAAMSVFFEHDFLELLFVRPARRRQGVATALVHAVEARTRTPKLFTSTNQSNVPMQRLCERLGFDHVGVVEGLDEGDPELFYLKRLPDSEAAASAPIPPAPRRSPAAPPAGRARRSRQSGSG